MTRFFLLFIFFILCVSNLFSKSIIKLGIDILEEENFASIKNKEIILFANQASRNSEGTEEKEY